MRYFVTLSYDGAAYHGWQIQPNANSVQETLQNAFSTILRQDIEIVGAGRTDTGVNASKMIAHFDVCAPIDAIRLVKQLNRLLPQDIAIQNICPVVSDAHSRFSALSRTYHYHIVIHNSSAIKLY